MSTPYPRLWQTAERDMIVEDGDPRAAFLAWSGHEPVPDDVLATIGQPAPAPEPEPEPDDQVVTVGGPVLTIVGENGPETFEAAPEPEPEPEGPSMPEPPADREPIEVKEAPAPADKRGTRPADKARTRATK